MTSKGEGAYPPRDRNMNCQRCGGWGWENYDDEELDLVGRIEELSQLVFGVEYWASYIGSEKPRKRFCPGCCGKERKSRDDYFLADCLEVAEILEELAELTRDGQNFKPKENSGSVGSELLGDLTGTRGIFYGTQKIKYSRPWRTNLKKTKLTKPKRSPKRLTSSPAKNKTLADDLTKLVTLLEKGALTEKEFQRAKSKILED